MVGSDRPGHATVRCPGARTLSTASRDAVSARDKSPIARPGPGPLKVACALYRGRSADRRGGSAVLSQITCHATSFALRRSSGGLRHASPRGRCRTLTPRPGTEGGRPPRPLPAVHLPVRRTRQLTWRVTFPTEGRAPAPWLTRASPGPETRRGWRFHVKQRCHAASHSDTLRRTAHRSPAHPPGQVDASPMRPGCGRARRRRARSPITLTTDGRARLHGRRRGTGSEHRARSPRARAPVAPRGATPQRWGLASFELPTQPAREGVWPQDGSSVAP